MVQNKWVCGKIVKVKHWTKNLFSLIINAPINPFIAGQFTKLSIEIDGKKIQRAYSYVNAPNNNSLEFYLTTIPKGQFSMILHDLRPGDTLMITKEANGLFILDEIPQCNILWMLATGTAIGPYLSMLEQGEGLDRFNNIVLVHAVRFFQDLSYLPKMLELQKFYNDKLRVQTIISREQIPGSLTGHIPTLISNGSLEESVKLSMNSYNSHVMLCGNPKMVHDTQVLLNNNFGMRKNLKDTPGHITSEYYWQS